MTTLAFAKQYLFTPLNITYFWETSPHNVVNGGAFLNLKPRDMAKFGFLFLNNGSWDGEVIVTSDWVQQAVYQYDLLNENIGYGFQWWISPPSKFGYFAYQARGYQGQWICCIPELDLLVVFTGGFTGPNPYDELVAEYILPSVTEIESSESSEEKTSFSFSLVILFLFVIRKKTKK
jgi:CubicO group peptidase (beta-lactamase class C family)